MARKKESQEEFKVGSKLSIPGDWEIEQQTCSYVFYQQIARDLIFSHFGDSESISKASFFLFTVSWPLSSGKKGVLLNP